MTDAPESWRPITNDRVPSLERGSKVLLHLAGFTVTGSFVRSSVSGETVTIRRDDTPHRDATFTGCMVSVLAPQPRLDAWVPVPPARLADLKPGALLRVTSTRPSSTAPLSDPFTRKVVEHVDEGRLVRVLAGGGLSLATDKGPGVIVHGGRVEARVSSLLPAVAAPAPEGAIAGLRHLLKLKRARFWLRVALAGFAFARAMQRLAARLDPPEKPPAP